MKHAPNDTNPPSDAQLLALLLGETGDPAYDTLRQQLESDPALVAKASRLQHAADTLKEALATPESPASDAPPTALDPARRARLLAQLSTPTAPQKTETPQRKRINFSHPFWGIGLAACLFFGLSIHFILKTGGIFDANVQEIAHLRQVSAAAEAPPPPQPEYKDQIAKPLLEEPAPPALALNQMEMLLNPGAEKAISFEDFEKREGRARLQNTASEIKNRRSERRLTLADSTAESDMATFIISDDDKAFANPNTHTNTRYRADRNDAGSAISVVTTEFMEDVGSTDISSVFAYDNSADKAGGLTGNLSDQFLNLKSENSNSSPPAKPLFGEYVPNEEEEIFELSPFEVNADNNQGYRATSTLSGSRLRTNLADRASSTSSGRDRYGFFTPYLPKEEEETPSRKNLKSTFDRDTAPPRLPFQTGTAPYADIRFNTPTTQNPKPETRNPKPTFRFNLAEGLATPKAESQTQNTTSPEPEPQDPESRTQQPTTNLREYPENLTASDPQSTFSLNVSDVSYRLAESYLAQNARPPAGSLRTEEFVNAFDYGDPTPSIARKIGFVWERAHWPFAHDRDVLRFSLQTAANGRASSQPLNLVLAIDSSGSMSRPDRVEIVKTLANALQENLTPSDRISVISFDREARLVLDGQSLNTKTSLSELATHLNPQGGTDLESAIHLAYQTAQKHFQENAINRVILITDGAANLGNTDADELRKTVEENRIRGIALDCFGIGFDGHDDTFLESLSRNGDGRYRFLRTPEDAALELGPKLAGLLRPAAYDVKVQVEFNPERVERYQQLGYQQHQIADADFRNNAVDAAELAATESGNALYLAKILPDGRGDIGLVRVRYRDAQTGTYQELSWNLPYNPDAHELATASPSLRLASVAAAFAALLNESPIAQEISYSDLINLTQNLPQYYPTQTRVQTLSDLINQARRL